MMVVAANGFVAQALHGVLEWLESVRWPDAGWGRWKYNVHMARDYGLIPSAIAIRLLHAHGRLDSIREDELRDAISFFQSAQDPADGYFKDPLVSSSDRLDDAVHSWEDVWGQMGAASQALDLLGSAPLYPLPRVSFANLAKVNVRDWVLSLDWTNPWHVGERFFRAINAYKRGCGLPPEIACEDPVISDAFSAYEQAVVDPETGLPSKRGCTDPSVAMAGLFKVIFAYNAVGRRVPYPERAIDATLALQQPGGEFGPGRDMCINWDAVWVLGELDRLLGGAYRHGDMASASARLAESLSRLYRKPDGGFAFCREHCLTAHHSIFLSDPVAESDMLGTQMCLKCLEYADEWST